MDLKKVAYVLAIIAGLGLLLSGFFVFSDETEKQLSGACIGVGAGLATLGISLLITSLAVPRLETSEAARLKEIEVHDERNIFIREKASHQTCVAMTYILSAAAVLLALLGAELWIVLVAVALIIIQVLLVIGFTGYYAKRV